ncbi:MAG: RnfH family protein, partial [Proteobacteria bacterium]|nr:RnfH family protein [Pseudomonadota bacterium]
RDAVQASGIASHFPELELDELEKGIWGRRRPEDHEVRSGDRVEIYRPLVVDPREARRRRAGRSG